VSTCPLTIPHPLGAMLQDYDGGSRQSRRSR